MGRGFFPTTGQYAIHQMESPSVFVKSVTFR
jgi:hypothetical protein